MNNHHDYLLSEIAFINSEITRMTSEKRRLEHLVESEVPRIKSQLAKSKYVSRLTEVAKMHALGMTNRKIGELIGVSPVRVAQLLYKFNLEDRDL